MKISLLHTYSVPLIPGIVVLLFLVPAILFFIGLSGCSSGPDQTSEQLNTDTLAEQKSDSANPGLSRESVLNLKRKIISKRKNPILATAYHNPHFNAQKWLKSDHRFYNRSNPRKISDYDHVIKKIARRYGFDWRLIAAQIYTESNFQNEAKSHVGAIGLMQVMPNTAEFMGYDPNLILEPEINIAVGCMYDQRMYSLWGKQTKDYNRLAFALASYNAGRGRVLKSYSSKDERVTWEKVYPLLPVETQSYVHKIYLKHDLYKRHIIP